MATSFLASFKTIRDRKKHIDDFKSLFASTRDLNIRRNRILLGIVHFYGKIYIKETRTEKKKKTTNYKRKFPQSRRLPIRLGVYIEHLTELEFTRNTKTVITLLFKHYSEIESLVVLSFSFPDVYNLSSKNLLPFLKRRLEPPIHVSPHYMDQERNRDTFERAAQRQDIVPLPANYPDYNDQEFCVPPPQRNKKFVVSTLGNLTIQGHSAKLKKLKYSVDSFTWPNGQELAPNSESPYHFSGNGVPIGTTIDEFLPRFGRIQVCNWAHSFNPFFRNQIERNYDIKNCFVAENFLHKYKGLGFFLVLTDDSIFHVCCNCQNIRRENYKP